MSRKIVAKTSGPLDPNGTMHVPAMSIPGFRIHRATKIGCQENILIDVWGGIGDIVCAEPAIRYAVNKFTDLKFTINTETPEVFRHVRPLARVVNRAKESLNQDDFLVLKPLYNSTYLNWEFVCYPIMNRVDYCAINLLKGQLPVKDRCIKLLPTEEEYNGVQVDPSIDVAVHPGRTWKSRTIPVEWWNEVISILVDAGARPILFGSGTDSRRGTLPVETKGCQDLRGQLSLMSTVALLHKTRILLTNDSAPVHLAASGDTWIGFLSTVNHPDFLMHWRDGGQWAWRMKDLALGGVYEDHLYAPNFIGDFDLTSQTIKESWLPEPKTAACWALEKL